MAEHYIEIDPLSPLSVWRARGEYYRILREFDDKVDIFLRRLADRGREVFDSLGYTVDGGEITVTVERIEDGYCIDAAGQGVIFLEFGAGDATIGDKYASMMPFDVSPGSYSETHDQQYSTYGQWVFGGILYTEVLPRNGMQRAWETVMQEWRDIAREVFA